MFPFALEHCDNLRQPGRVIERLDLPSHMPVDRTQLTLMGAIVPEKPIVILGTSDGRELFGSVGEFPFHLPVDEDSSRQIESLKILLEGSPEKVRIIVPDTLDSWMSMRESYDEKTSWKWNREALIFSSEHKVKRENETYFLPSKKDLVSFPEDMTWNTISSEKGRSGLTVRR